MMQLFFLLLVLVSAPLLAAQQTLLLASQKASSSVGFYTMDGKLLATVPGVGRKTAARLILELRGKLVPASGVAADVPSRDDAEVVAALRSLGYTTAEAHGVLVRIPRDPDLTIEDRVVAALRELAEP